MSSTLQIAAQRKNCQRSGCKNEQWKKKYCKTCFRDCYCPFGPTHDVLPWNVAYAADGTKYGKCQHCEREHVMREAGNYEKIS